MMCETIEAHLEWMRDPRPHSRPYAETTINDRRRVLNQLDRQLPRGCCDVYPGELDAFLATPPKRRSKDGPWAPWTSHTYDNHLRAFYRWAYAAGELSSDPMLQVRRRPCGICRPKPLSPDDLFVVFQRSPEPWYGAAMLAVGAGLRVSEIADLTRADVTEDFVHVRRGKGGKERFVDTAGCLWAYVAQLPAGPIVCRPYGRTVTGPYLSSQQRAHWVSIGMPHVHLHRLRHTFATIMFQAGHQDIVIRDLMLEPDTGPMTQGLADYVAAQIRVELARRRLTIPQLATRMGMSEDWIRRRANGEYGITMSDLERIADGLGVPAGYFLPESQRVVSVGNA